MPAASFQSGSRVVVTGIGIYCAVGKNADEVMRSVRAGRTGIGEIRSFDTSDLKIHHAAEIQDHDPTAHFEPTELEEVDRTAQYAVIAARQAVDDAGIDPRRDADGRVALVMGVCAGGKKELQEGRLRQALSGETGLRPGDAVGESARASAEARAFLATSHYAQTEVVARKLGVHGPRSTPSTACASSATALGYAYGLLQAGEVDAVIAGGADSFSAFTYAGFYALGAMAPRPASPFSVGIGVSFGEGAGFVVLEPAERAAARGAKIYGELLGYGATSDAYHITSPDPSGVGLRRAMELALRCAGLDRASVGYVNAHGTGTRDNDLAETLAVKGAFAPLTPPPVSSSKSFLGHTLGASAVLEFIVSLLCMNEGLLPPTVNFESPRPGCDLDYVPNHPRPARFDAFLSNSAAFGGVNVTVAGGRAMPRGAASRPATDAIAVTGLGVVSAVGCGLDAFREALRGGASGIAPLDGPALRGRPAATIRGFDLRDWVRHLDGRRLDRVTQFAAAAAGMAIAHAGLRGPDSRDERLGTVFGLTRGPACTEERFFDALRKGGIPQLSPKHFPGVVVSTIGGQVCAAFGLKGATATLVEGTTAGLHALAYGYETLRQHDELDALLVVATDEIGTLYQRVYEQLGLLDTEGRDGRFALYGAKPRGMILGEGAVAIALERLGHARARDARVLAVLAGCGLTSDAEVAGGLAPGGEWIERAARRALEAAALPVEAVSLVYGHGRGVPAYDDRERRGLERLLGSHGARVGCVMGNTGVAEASCGLLSVAAAVLSLTGGEAFPIVSSEPPCGDLAFVTALTPGRHEHVLVAGGTEDGNNAAVVLSSRERGE